jgi:uncharacterized repeat protein (TIGR01451 family)
MSVQSVVVGVGEHDAVTGNNSGGWSVDVRGVADLGVDLLMPEGLMTVGRAIDVELRVINSGPGTARDIGVSYSCSGGRVLSISESDGSPSEHPAHSLVWHIAHLGKGEEVSWVIKLIPESVGTIRQTFRILGTSTLETGLWNNEVEVSGSVFEVPRLRVTQSHEDKRVMVGQEVRYQLLVHSESSVSMDDVVVQNLIPEGAEVVSASAGQGQVEILEDRVLFHLGRLGSEQSAIAGLVLKPSVAGVAVNRLEIVAPHPLVVSGDSRTTLELPVLATPPMKLKRVGESLLIDWPAAGAGYRVEYSDNLSEPDWQPYPGAPEMAVERQEWQVFIESAPKGRFYRLVRDPAP